MEKEFPLSKMYNFNALCVRKAHHQKFEEGQPQPKTHVVSPTALIGIEIELENITQFVNLEYYWSHKEDGSLRNYGAEFVSIPLRGYQIPYALKYLNNAIYQNNKPDFSTRTSVHIHLNVRDMPEEQIKVLILLYALFERHFFNFAGTKRETSVFCVPLYRTQQLNGILNWSMEELSLNWHKYSAINCGTITGNNDVPRFGTIEFRHLYGTLDETIILDWINQIMLLREASHQIKLNELLATIRTMNTTSAYAAMYKNVFKHAARMDLMTKKDFEYCVTTTKLALFGWDYAKRAPAIQAESAYWQNKLNKNKGLKQPKTAWITTDEMADQIHAPTQQEPMPEEQPEIVYLNTGQIPPAPFQWDNIPKKTADFEALLKELQEFKTFTTGAA